MKALLITQAQMKALRDMNMMFVVVCDKGVVYSAHSGLESAKSAAERFEMFPALPYSLFECVAEGMEMPS